MPEQYGLTDAEINAVPLANPRLVAQAQLRKVTEILETEYRAMMYLAPEDAPPCFIQARRLLETVGWKQLRKEAGLE